MQRRIERRLQVTAQPDLAAYYQYLQAHPRRNQGPAGRHADRRDQFSATGEAFQALERDVMPSLVKSLGTTAAP